MSPHRFSRHLHLISGCENIELNSYFPKTGYIVDHDNLEL